MTEELEQLLKNLKLRHILQVYGEQLHTAEKSGVSYSSSLACCARRGTTGRKVPFYARRPGVNRKQVRALEVARLDQVAGSLDRRAMLLSCRARVRPVSETTTGP